MNGRVAWLKKVTSRKAECIARWQVVKGEGIGMELGRKLPLATTPTDPLRKNVVPGMINVFIEQKIHALRSG